MAASRATDEQIIAALTDNSVSTSEFSDMVRGIPANELPVLPPPSNTEIMNWRLSQEVDSDSEELPDNDDEVDPIEGLDTLHYPIDIAYSNNTTTALLRKRIDMPILMVLTPEQYEQYGKENPPTSMGRLMHSDIKDWVKPFRFESHYIYVYSTNNYPHPGV